MVNFAGGKIRQVGIYCKKAFDTDDLDLVQGVIDDLDAEHKPLSALFAFYAEGTITISSLTDLRTASVTCLGAALGAVSKASVHENIGWVGKFDMAEVELETPALADGTLISAISQANLDLLHSKGYIFLHKRIGIAGTYFKDSHAAIDVTSDYAYIESNRTIDKAIRGVRTYLLPEINAPVTVDADSGKLNQDYCSYLEAKAGQALNQMQQNSELSGYQVFVDPDQNVLSTSEIKVNISIVPKGVSRTLTVTIGFTTSLS